MEADVRRAWLCSSLLLKANSRNNVFREYEARKPRKIIIEYLYNISSCLLKNVSNKYATIENCADHVAPPPICWGAGHASLPTKIHRRVAADTLKLAQSSICRI